MGKQWKQWQILFSWAQKSLQMVTAAMKLKDAWSLEERLWPAYSILTSRDIALPTKAHLVKAIVFPVVMYGCESWTIKKAESWRIDALELWCWRRFLRVQDSLGLQIDSISPSSRKSVPNIHWKDWCWSWNFNALATWCKELTHWKDPDAGKNRGQEEKGTTEDEMAGWHHRLNGREFE